MDESNTITDIFSSGEDPSSGEILLLLLRGDIPSTGMWMDVLSWLEE